MIIKLKENVSEARAQELAEKAKAFIYDGDRHVLINVHHQRTTSGTRCRNG